MTAAATTKQRRKSETYFAAVFTADGKLETCSLQRRTVRGAVRQLVAQLYRGEIRGLYVHDREAVRAKEVQ